MPPTLYYVHDPMCSWCWGFEPVRRELFEALAGRMAIRRLLGGLAPDSDAPMPADLQATLQATWRRIQQTIPGTRFNYDFWTECAPRRSTYPANRAVLAAREQGEEFDALMTARIQRAYYLEARNPSDNGTLIELAADLDLNEKQFAASLVAPDTRQRLLDEIARTRAMGMSSFPSLAVSDNGALRHIGLHYTDAAAMLREVLAA
ncbi:MAG: DsbA family protein [Gammaproteobacteria bacterium]|nr:DsbA family protein [Gammaproteobacteria bacterium]NNL99378.1 DsbA family protein [Gammaproteobacteria bacterium]